MDELTDSIASLSSKISTTTRESRKGGSGTILVIGGCKYYTGAPFFVSMAALYTGSELVYLFSETEGIIPLKTLLPECIVCGIEYQEWILRRITACVVGSGLGRPSVSTSAEINRILRRLDERNIPIIVDGDAIRLSEDLGIYDLRNVILTPNVSEQKHVRVTDNFFYIQKGFEDVVIGKNRKFVVSNKGCSKRIGGQGDILAGTVASLISKLDDPVTGSDILASMVLGCRLVRAAGNAAYKKSWKSLITRDILECLREVFKETVCSFSSL